MADGTFATWAGIPCFTAKFIRARGWESDTSEVEIPARIGAGKPLGMSTPQAGTIARRPKGDGPAGGGSSSARPSFSGPAPSADAIPHEGFLILTEVVNGQEWTVTIGPLFVARAEAVRTPDGSDTARIRLYLVDERYFWPRGFMRRWSYNRRRGDGTIAQDSVKPGGAPWARAEIAAETTLSLFRSPALVAMPAEWQGDTRAVEFLPCSPAVTALSVLVTEAGLEAPCLRLDNTIALHKAGEGRVGYARGGRGANKEDFPPQVRAYKDGAGQGVVTENGYPEDYVVVAGGVRIASTALDSWVPILILNGRDVVFLTEERMRFLTDGRYGLDWLHRFILQPNAYQSVVGLSTELLDVFRTQPYRLFLMPGALVETKVQKDPAAGKADFGVVYEPGPNAHLLPLLDRAETAAGRRLPVLIEASRYTTVHQALRGTEAQIRMAGILRAISLLRSQAPKRKDRVGAAPPGTISGTARPDDQGAFGLNPITVADVFKGNDLRAGGRGVSIEELQRNLDRVREIDSYRDTPAGDVFADELEKLTAQQLQAEEDLGADAGRTEMFEIAQEILAVEKRLKELTDLGGPDALKKRLDAQGVRDALLNSLSEKLEKIERDRAATKERERIGGDSGDKPLSMVILKNLRRAEVKGRVYSAEQGIVEIDELAVHAEIDPTAFKAGDSFPAVPSSPAHARGVPCPVRVTFGAVVRPRTDRPWGTSAPRRPVTGEPAPIERLPGETLGAFQARRRRELEAQVDAVTPQPGETPAEFLARRGRDCPPEPDVIPEALSDDESYYVAAFRRTGRGAGARVPLDAVPRDQAVVLSQPEFVELVPIEENGNRGDLDEQAEALALARFLVADQVQTTRTTLARAWPVQCDGLVSSVEIAMRFKEGAPCGFETIVTSGGLAPAAKIRPRPRTGNGGGARREGLT